MDSKKFWIILAVIIAGFIGFITFNKNDTSENSTAVSSQGSQNFYGKQDSKVTLTEFVDFQCEACYAYYPHVKEIKEKYKDRVKFQIRNFPITSHHQYAMQAARSAEAAARQGKFFEMHDKLFEGQPEWSASRNAQTYFDQYAQEIGLDMNKFNTDRSSSDVNAVINKDLKDVQDLGGNGTPTFVLNGEKIENPGPSVEALSKILDEALAKAQ